MDARELRLGNLIHGYASATPTYKHVHVVDMATIGIVNGDVPMGGQLVFEPIPLIRAWLIKLGFTQTNENWYKWKFGIKINVDGDLVIDQLKFNNVVLPVKIIHVHQLQNAICALTSVELEVNQ